MTELGLDLGHHTAQPLTQDLIQSFNLTLTMEKAHKQHIQQIFPYCAENIFMLSEMVGIEKDVEDPGGKSLNEYRKTIKELQSYFIRGWKTILKFAE